MEETILKKDSPHFYERKMLRYSVLSLAFPVLLLLNGYAWFPKSYHLFFEFFLSVPAFLFVSALTVASAGFSLYSACPPELNTTTYETWKDESSLIGFFMLLPLCFLMITPVILYNIISLL